MTIKKASSVVVKLIFKINLHFIQEDNIFRLENLQIGRQTY